MLARGKAISINTAIVRQRTIMRCMTDPLFKGLRGLLYGCYKRKCSAPGQRAMALSWGGSGRLYRVCPATTAVKPPLYFSGSTLALK